MAQDGNRAQIESWNEAGEAWARQQERIDAQMAPHAEHGFRAADAKPGERVADVGCGCGTTSLALAEQVGRSGAVVGIDVSQPMLAHARRRASAHPNVSFVEGDAQDLSLPEPVDLVFSRFGVMFFSDPDAAFRNIHSWLRPGGRMVFVTWQSREDNPWISIPGRAAADFVPMPEPPGPGAPGMFSLADPDHVRSLLGGAGFRDVVVRGEHVRIRPPDGSAAEATALFMDIGPVPGALRDAGADADLRQQVAERMEALYEEQRGPRGVELDSAIWVVEAVV